MMRLVSSLSDLEVAWDEYDAAMLTLTAMYVNPAANPPAARLDQAAMTAARWAAFRDILVNGDARVAPFDPEPAA